MDDKLQKIWSATYAVAFIDSWRCMRYNSELTAARMAIRAADNAIEALEEAMLYGEVSANASFMLGDA
jgi:hypothetical protein